MVLLISLCAVPVVRAFRPAMASAETARTASKPKDLPTDAEYRAAFRARCEQARTAFARQAWSPGQDTRRRIYLGVVKVATGIDASTGLQYLRDAVADRTPAWQSFETYAFMDAVLRLGSRLPPDLVSAIRGRLAASFTADVGFTDNHHLQFYTARYLFGQTWPDGPTFADGKSPAAAAREAAGWITAWILETARRGMYEYDSPNYHHLYLLCLSTLCEYAHDAEIRQRAWMMEQLLLAEWAAEYVDGVWIGAHSREKYNQVTHTTNHPGAATPFGPLFFGRAPLDTAQPEGFFLSLGALQAFEALPIVARIAAGSRTPYVQRSLKPPRRGPGIVHGEPTWKYDYVTPEFALGSSWGDLTDVENHRWDLTWTSPRDGSTCFFINPSYSAAQLIRYYWDTTVDKVLDNILRQRPYYADPNKWVEGSPYEDVFQQENLLVALYDIPPDAWRQHVNGFFPHVIDERRERGPWIFCRAERVFFAVWTSSPGTWERAADHDRLVLRTPKAAVVLVAVPAADVRDFPAFCRQIPERVHPSFDPGTMTATAASPGGRSVRFTHHGARVVDGAAVRLEGWPLFDGPWISAEPGNGVITLTRGPERVVLDFNTGNVTPSR